MPAIVALVGWALLAVVLSVVAMRVHTRRTVRARHAAVDEILAERGLQREPGEPNRTALIRARATDSMRPLRAASVHPPPPAHANGAWRED